MDTDLPTGRQDAPAGARRPRGATLRAIVLGIVLIPPNALWLQSMELIWDSGQPTMLSLFFNAVFTVLAVAAVNLALRRLLPRWALSSGELVVVYAMVSLGSAIAGHDFLQILALMIPACRYFATPENHWEDLFAGQLSSPLLMSDASAVRDFWEGKAQLYSWHAVQPWLAPVGLWAGFAIALLTVMLCINVLVWRRWSEQERLTYPLTEIPFQVTKPGFQMLGPALMGSGFFWLGFAVAASLDLLNGLAHLYPALPSIKLTAHDLRPYLQAYPWRAMGYTTVSAYPFAIGLGYLMPQDFLFSCWFFYWFWKAELIGGYLLGRHYAAFPYVKEQTFGAYAGIALFACWTGRKYLVQLLADVFGGRRPPDEERQAAPYRVTLIVLTIGIALLLLFSTQLLGVTLPAAVYYLGAYLVMSLAISRMRAEFGLPVHDLFTGPLAMAVGIGGTGVFSRRNLVRLSLFWWLERIQRSHPMPHQIEGLGLGERRGVAGSGMLTALAIAIVVGTVAGFWAMLHLGYTHGFAFMPTDAPYLGNAAFSRPQSWTNFATHLDIRRLAGLLVGSSVTVGLMLMRQRHVWWPFHPVGYAASSMWFIGLLWVPLFVAWVVKGLVTRYGGHKLYMRLAPMFVGLVLGEFVVGGLWGLIGTIGKYTTYRFWSY